MQLIIMALLLQLPAPVPALNTLEHRPATVERLSYPDLFSQPKPLEVTL